MTLKSHALADVFPALDGAEFARLVDDIKTHGGFVAKSGNLVEPAEGSP